MRSSATLTTRLLLPGLCIATVAVLAAKPGIALAEPASTAPVSSEIWKPDTPASKPESGQSEPAQVSNGQATANQGKKAQLTSEPAEKGSSASPVSTSTSASQSTTKTAPANAANPSAANKADAGQSVVFQSLAQMDELMTLGVPSLALSLLDGEQQAFTRFSADWYGFEYKRILLLAELNQWQAVIDRTDWLLRTAQPGYQIVPPIRLWFETQQVIARLQLKQADAALAQLQTLMWQSDVRHRDPGMVSLWRQLVIRIYLQKNAVEDARRAMVRYQFDYPDQALTTDWLILQARVQLKTGHPGRAIDLLEQIETQDALDVETLRWIAELQYRPAIAPEVGQQMRERLDGQVLSKYQRWAYSYVAWLASSIEKDLPAQVRNMEAMLSIKLHVPLFDDDYQVAVDDLWALYEQYGLRIANDMGLLIGAEQEWNKQAEALREEHAEEALALNVAWVLQGDHFDDKLQHQAIVEILEARQNGLELITRLYLHSSRVDDVDKLPEEVRFRLVDHALSEADYTAAVALMRTMDEPPEGKSLFDWRMRKARVLVLEGAYHESEQLIRRTFAEMKSISRQELDRYIQVVFDFQTVQQHEIALRLFALVSMQGLNENLKRELHFWKAESYSALAQHDRAALHYLESAYAVKEGVHDLWAQSARFKAGNALMSAGIYVDSEKVFNDLLVITASDSRRALIKQNLQKIRLLKTTAQD